MSTTRRAATASTGLALAAAAALAAAQPATSTTTSSSTEPRLVVSSSRADAFAPALSHTGRYVAHLALRRDQDTPRQQVRRKDLATGASELLNPSVDGGVAAGNYGMPPVISADGARVSFTTDAARLVKNDTNGRFDAFVRDASRDVTLWASRDAGGGPSNGNVGSSSMSRNGRHVVFTSNATDLVAGSTTTNADVFRRDLAARTTEQVTVRPDGSPSRGPGANSADISADGNLVAFTSYNTDLVTYDDADVDSDLFVRDLTTHRTRWLSPGLPAGADPSGVVISPDGRWISTRWYDGSLHLTHVRTATTSSVAADAYALYGAFSSDRDRFVYVSAGVPHARDLVSGEDIPIPVPDGGSVTGVTVSGDGRFAAYDWTPDDGGPTRIYRVLL